MKSHHAITIMSIWIVIGLQARLLEAHSFEWMAGAIVVVYLVYIIYLFIKEWYEEI
jgi:hypothetical protein